MSYLEIVITALICSGLDIVTIKLIALKNDMKNNVQSYQKNKTQDIKTQDIETQDIKTQDIETQDIETQDIKTQDIETQDIEKKSLQHYTEDLGQNKTKLINNQSIPESPYCSQNVSGQKTQDIKQNEDKDKDEIKNQDIKTQDIENQDIETQDIEKKSLQHYTEDLGQNKNQDMKTEDIIKKVEEYILLKYVPGDLIKVGQLKKDLKIKDRCWKDKILPTLTSAKLNANKRLERVKIGKNDNLKRVK